MVQLHDRRPAEVDADASVRGWTVLGIAGGVFAAGVGAVVVSRWWTGTGYTSAPAGLPDPGPLTAIALPVVHLACDGAGMLVAGLLLVSVLAQPVRASGDRKLAVLAARWSWVWAGSTLAWIVFTMSDMTGLSVTALPSSPDLLVVVLGTQRILAQVVTLWIAVAVALYAGRVSGSVGTAAVGCLALVALLPSALSGHAGHHNETTLTVAALAVHILAAALWVGGLLAVVLYLRDQPDRLAVVLPRFSAVALLCAVAVAVSGVIVSVVLLGSWAALTGSNRGHLIALKGACLTLLVMIGYWHRCRTVGPATRGTVRPLLRLAGVEVLLMGATVGLAVTLSTTA